MVSLRLSRRGKKNQPTYRLLALDKRKDPWGDYLEDLGFYNPRTNPSTVQFNAERIKYWLGVGAQPSETVHNLLVDAGLLDKPKVKVVRTKKAAPGEKPASPSAAPTPPPATK